MINFNKSYLRQNKEKVIEYIRRQLLGEKPSPGTPYPVGLLPVPNPDDISYIVNLFFFEDLPLLINAKIFLSGEVRNDIALVHGHSHVLKADEDLTKHFHECVQKRLEYENCL